MRTKDLALIGIWAAGTAGLLAIVQPQPLTAGPEVRTIETQPTLTIDGCEVQFRCERGADGAAPVLLVTARNSGKEPAHLRWTMQMMSTPPVSQMSRVVPMPKESWKEEGDVELDPYQSSNLKFEPKVAMAKGANVFFVVGAGKQTVSVMPVATGREELAWAAGSPGKRQ